MLVAISIAAGCGGDDSADGPAVEQRVTRDFGQKVLAVDNVPLTESATALRVLTDHRDAGVVDNRIVESIDGLAQNPNPANETSWAMNVNGLEADKLPPDYDLYPGDVIQWDLRDWYVTLDVRATVGAFPETFTRGFFGKRFPVTVECENTASVACREVIRAFQDAGVPIDGSRPKDGLPPRGQPQRAHVLVGKWNHWRDRPWPHRVDKGPQFSGIFARFAPDGRSLRLLNWDGGQARTSGAGTGLVGAMQPTEEDLMWLVTGVDDAGVTRAARALDAEATRDAYAVVATPSGVEKLPLRAKPKPEPVAPAIDPDDVETARYERSEDDEPAVRLPAGPPPRGRLLIEDLVRGAGKAATQGSVAVVNYAGFVYSERDRRWRRYNSSYRDGARPLVVAPGQGGVIEGFERGVTGMRAGGRRQVIIPPADGYGRRGDPPRVGPKDTLLFVLDVESVQ